MGIRFRSENPPEHIRWVDLNNNIAIPNWITALSFWKHFDSDTHLDLVVADVQFEDRSSPLGFSSTGKEVRLLPTGLSHFKPFAAMARARGAPIGVALHTKDYEIWKKYSKEPGDPFRQAMGLLAAHEIGEIAAILGQLPENFEELRPENKLEVCWTWLRDNSGDDFDRAFPKALASYRRCLASADVPFEDWEKLTRWCEQMQRTPLPLTQHDPGFSFRLKGGASVCISFRSLFADVISLRDHELALSDFDFSQPLPQHCFLLRRDDKFFELDEHKWPKIGALIYQCGGRQIHEAYQTAIRILKAFPTPLDKSTPAQNKLNKIEKTEGPLGSVASGLAVFFKVIEREYRLQQEWRKAYQGEYPYDAKTNTFLSKSEMDRGAALVDLVARVYSVIKSNAEYVSEGDQADSTDHPDNSFNYEEVSEWLTGNHRCEGDQTWGIEGVRFCLSLLVLLNLLKYNDAKEEYSLSMLPDGSDRNRLPPIANGVSNMLFKSGVLSEVDAIQPVTFVKIVFGGSTSRKSKSRNLPSPEGVNASDHNFIGRIMYRAFLSRPQKPSKGGATATPRKVKRKTAGSSAKERSNATLGREFWRDYLNGDAPEWIKDICRLYAQQELKWTDESGWPRAFRRQAKS